MIKKALFTTALVALIGAFFFGRDVFSYVTTSASWVKDSVRDNVPIEFEIERARKMLKDLKPVVDDNRRRIAREEVEVERLDRQIKAQQTKLQQDQAEILKLKNDLGDGKDTYTYGGRSYSVQQVKVDLSRRFDRYKTSDSTLESLRQMREARQRGLDAATQKLQGVLAAQGKLQLQIENLEARNQLVQAAETTCEYNFNDSELSHLKELVADLQTRIDVRAKLADQENDAYSEIPVSEPSSENIVEQVTNYFGTDSSQIAIGK